MIYFPPFLFICFQIPFEYLKMKIKLVIGDYCYILVLIVLFMTVDAEPSTSRLGNEKIDDYL
ncbi:hypothetical protein Sjap_021577 [Stephania japonica]|uniref:Uncharacterized protein n=1 Tax=Stephania japonica TaxID=461633 RepID=A0AAP0EPU5_9MAGN